MTDKEIAALAAVASIHEEHEITLDGLTIEELEKLKSRVESTITKKLESEIPLYDWSFDPPDDRSYGTISFGATTLFGKIEYEGQIDSSGEIAEGEMGLMPEGREYERDPVPDTVEDFDGFHAKLTQDTTDDQAKAIVVKALLEWQKSKLENG